MIHGNARCSSKRNWNFCESLEQLIVIELEVLLDRTWIDKDRVSVHYFLCHSVFFVLQYLKLFCAERVRPIRRRKQGLKRSFQETHSNPMHRTKSLFAYAASRTSTLLCVSIFDMLTKNSHFQSNNNVIFLINLARFDGWNDKTFWVLFSAMTSYARSPSVIWYFFVTKKR